MACEDQVTVTQLENAAPDTVTLAEIATSKAGGVISGARILSSTDRFGVDHLTAEGALARIQSNPLNGGVWAAGITFSAYNDYMIYSGVAYKPKQTTSLPYVSDATPNVANVEPFLIGQASNVSLTIDDTDTNVDTYLNSIKTRETVTEMLSLSSADAQLLIATGQTVTTKYNNTTSLSGGATYSITSTNPGNLSTLVSGVWVGANHDLGGGYYAKITSPEKSILNFGAISNNATVNDSAIAAARSFSYRSVITIPEGNFTSDLTVHQKYTGLGRVYKSDGEPNRSFLHIGTGDTEKDTVPVCGIIRQDSDQSGWYYIDDSGHEPNGFIDTIIDDPGDDFRLQLEFSFVLAKIGSINITPDTWYAGHGVTTGQGVNNTNIWLEFYKTLSVDVNNNAGVGTYSAFFGDTITTTKNVDGTITVTHPTLSSSSSQAPSVTNAAISSVSGQVPIVRSYNTTSVTYGMYAAFSGTATYSGGSWNISTPATEKPTATVVGDTIEITHQTLRSLGVQVSARNDSPFIFSASPSGTSKTIIIVRDFSGAIVTPNLDTMKFQYHAQDLVLQEVPYGNCIVQRDGCPVKPKHLFGNVGNFWINGTVQV